MELNQYVDVGVTVNIVLSRPDGVTLSTTDPLMENTSRYLSTAMISSFGREQSGVYTCRTTISSDTLMTSGMEISGMERITVGKATSLHVFVQAYLSECNDDIILHVCTCRCLYLPKGCGPC